MNALKIKRNWLISLVIYYTLGYIFAFIHKSYGYKFDGWTRDFAGNIEGYSDELALSYLWWFLFLPMISLGAIYTIYYFIYLKKNLIFLNIFMYLLIVICLANLSASINYPTCKSIYGDYLLVPYGFILYKIVSFYLTSYFLINCYWLNKIYKRNLI